MANLKGKFCKVQFTNGTDSTSGIILDAETVRRASTAELSRYFPMTEILNMSGLVVSEPFSSFEQAFKA